MGKRNYTHVQELLPEIEAMLGSGKTQREVAEYFGFRDKYVVKSLVKRERAKHGSEKPGSTIQPQRAAEKSCLRQGTLLQSRLTRSAAAHGK